MISKNNKIYPLEKKTANQSKTMIKNFRFLGKNNIKMGKGGLICFYDKLIPLDDNNYYIPIGSLIDSK